MVLPSEDRYGLPFILPRCFFLNRVACRKCFAPLLGFTLPSTSFKVNSIKTLTSTGRDIATSGTAMFHIVSRGVCRIVATVAVLDGKLYSSAPDSSQSCDELESGHGSNENDNTMVALDSFVFKAVRFRTCL